MKILAAAVLFSTALALAFVPSVGVAQQRAEVKLVGEVCTNLACAEERRRRDVAPAPKRSFDEIVEAALSKSCLDVFGIWDSQTKDCSLIPQP